MLVSFDNIYLLSEKSNEKSIHNHVCKSVYLNVLPIHVFERIKAERV